jgi:S1-C subfamily serine protease
MQVSRRHAVLRSRPDGTFELEDLGSRNGTLLDGKPVDGSVDLHGGEAIQIGRTTLRVEADGDQAATPPPPPPPRTVVRPPGQSRVERAFLSIPEKASPRSPDSAIQRLKLTKAVKRLTILVIAAIALGVAAIVLAVTGVFSSDEPTASEVIEAATPSTMLVVAETEGGTRIGNGSGAVTDADQGFVVTNAHVASHGQRFEVGPAGDLREAQVLGVAPCEDLAVLQASSTTGFETLPLGSASDLQMGDTVHVLGYPGNASVRDDLQSATGSVSAIGTSIDPQLAQNQNLPRYSNVIQTDAPINAGNSGGPLIDNDTELVGINSVSGGTAENQGYAISVDRVKEVAPQLQEGRSMAFFGFDVFTPASQLGPTGLRGLGLPPLPGLVVEEGATVAGTSAARAGFGSAPALVTAVNGRRVSTPSEYCRAVRGLESGTRVPINFFDATGPGRVTLRLE